MHVTCWHFLLQELGYRKCQNETHYFSYPLEIGDFFQGFFRNRILREDTANKKSLQILSEIFSKHRNKSIHKKYLTLKISTFPNSLQPISTFKTCRNPRTRQSLAPPPRQSLAPPQSAPLGGPVVWRDGK